MAKSETPVPRLGIRTWLFLQVDGLIISRSDQGAIVAAFCTPFPEIIAKAATSGFQLRLRESEVEPLDQCELPWLEVFENRAAETVQDHPPKQFGDVDEPVE
jgi:hypothetical protein